MNEEKRDLFNKIRPQMNEQESTEQSPQKKREPPLTWPFTHSHLPIEDSHHLTTNLATYLRSPFGIRV